MPTTTTGLATSFISFSRASTATRVNASGFIESVASGTARLDYDPVTLAPRGLLVEEQRTNLLLQSGTLTNASWSKVASSAAASALISPSGAADAFKLTEDTTSGFHAVDQTVTFTAASYTYWAIVKKTERDFILLQENSSGAARRSWFNIANGTLGTVGAGHTAAIRNFGNGWYLCSVTFTGTALATIVRLGAATADGVAIYVGDGTSGIAVYAQQCELGSFPTSYIPTTSATVTRSADVASVPTSAFPYSLTAGTLVAEVTRSFPGTIVRGASLNDGSASNSIWVLSGTATQNGRITTAGVIQAAFGASLVETVQTDKVGMAWAANDAAGSQNGGAVSTDNSVTLPSGITTLGIGNVSSGFTGSGHVRRITYLPRRISNADLIARTA